MPELEPDKPETTVNPEKTPPPAPAAPASAAPAASAEKPSAEKPDTAGRKSSVPRGAKWAIVILSILCVLLLFALLEVAFLPQLIERDVNGLLQRMAGEGVEFRIKTISLTSAEVACKLKDTTRDGRPLSVGSIGSLSIRFSPIPLMVERTIESIDIENCNLVVDYSDGTPTIPAYDLFVKQFLSGEKKEKEDSAPVDDLNAVIPVKVKSISLSGSLSAVSRGEESLDTLHIPYAVKVCPDSFEELGWNKLECSFGTHFSTNGIRCKAVYLHKEKKVSLDLDDFSLATSALPGAIRSSLPRGLRAGITLKSKAEIDLNSLNVENLDNSSIELSGNLMLGYRNQQGLRIDNAATPFTLKMIPRIIPTVKPMNPPKTENLLVFTLGSMKGEYDAIPFELGGFEASVSLRRQTLQGGFQFTVADSEPAQFSFGGSLDEERKSFELKLENSPLLKAKYKGVDASISVRNFGSGLTLKDDKIQVTGYFNFSPEVEFDGGAFSPGLKGLTASVKPEYIDSSFVLQKSLSDSSFSLEPDFDIQGGEYEAKYNGMTVSLKPKSINTGFLFNTGEDGKESQIATIRLTDGELEFEKEGMKVSFRPESFSAGVALPFGGANKAHAELKGGKLLAELNGMTCEADTLAFNAESEDGKKFTVDAKIGGFLFKQLAANLAYDAPELALNNASFDLDSGLLSGEAVCADSRFSMPAQKILAKNLQWDFPFDYSLVAADPADAELADTGKKPDDAPRMGKVSLGDLEYDGKKAASLDGRIWWDDAAKTFHLKSDAQLFSINGELFANIVLGAAGVEVECGVEIPEQQADISNDLAGFFPQFEEISCTGKLGGSAVYRILPKTTTGSAKFSIADADVFLPEKKLEVRGLGLGFEIPELAVMKSAPGQTLSFKSLKFDKIETGACKATFRMEAPDAWQIENAMLDWCNGHIRLGGITYRIGQTTTEAVLYCDRLELPIFLTQIGLGQISGSGAINGTIPIVITQESGQGLPDNIYFEDAFLFSTPGEDGVIRGEIDESILNGENGIEMELAKDALKDFSYSWVRMSMLSTGKDKGDLKLSLQLDGRPNRALYYAFDENTASFVKSATPCIFQGIRLDTNVNIESGRALELVDYVKQIFSPGL